MLLNPSEIDANAQAKAFFQQSHNRNAEPYDFQAMGHALPSQQRPLPPAWASDFMAEVQIDGNPATLLSERAWGKSRASDHASNATWASDFTRPTQLPTSPSYVNQAPVLQLRPFSPPMNADMHPVGYGPQSLYSQAPGFAPYESFPQPREVSGVETSQQPRYQELSSTDDPQTGKYTTALKKDTGLADQNMHSFGLGVCLPPTSSAYRFDKLHYFRHFLYLHGRGS